MQKQLSEVKKQNHLKIVYNRLYLFYFIFPLNLVECIIFDQNHLVGEVFPNAFPVHLHIILPNSDPYPAWLDLVCCVKQEKFKSSFISYLLKLH